MQILGLHGMHFDAVVVEVEKYLLFCRLALAILWYGHPFKTRRPPMSGKKWAGSFFMAIISNETIWDIIVQCAFMVWNRVIYLRGLTTKP